MGSLSDQTKFQPSSPPPPVPASTPADLELCGYKVRLSPDPAAQSLLWQITGCNRFVWNWGRSERKAIYKASEGRVKCNYYDQANQLKPMKKMFPWLKIAPAQVLQQTLVDLEKAYANFFAGAGYPKPRLREDPQSFRFPQGKQIKVKGSHVYLPNIGWIAFKKSQEIPKDIRSATVSFDQDHWYISFCAPAPDRKTGHVFAKDSISLDMGVINPLTDEHNNVYRLPTKTRAERRKLRRLKRQISKKTVGGKNHRKALAKFRKADRKVTNRMKDARHKLTTNLAKNHRQVNIEDLSVKNMTASAKGTVETPGKRVRQKAGLNRAMLEISFGEIRRQLEYKCKRYGGVCVAVDPKNTSRRCPLCHHTAKGNRISRDLFFCQACLFMAPADQVGAINVGQKAVGLIVSACGVVKPRRHRSFKKKPPAMTTTLKQENPLVVIPVEPSSPFGGSGNPYPLG